MNIYNEKNQNLSSPSTQNCLKRNDVKYSSYEDKKIIWYRPFLNGANSGEYRSFFLHFHDSRLVVSEEEIKPPEPNYHKQMILRMFIKFNNYYYHKIDTIDYLVKFSEDETRRKVTKLWYNNKLYDENNAKSLGDYNGSIIISRTLKDSYKRINN